MKSGILTSIEIFFIKILAKLPFGLIFCLSHIFYLLMYYVIGYRKTTVSKNLKNAFPEKNENERKAISKKFYRHFSDLILETAKMSGISASSFEKRNKVANPGLINSYFDKGKSVMVLTMHYNNWEWGTYLTIHLKHKTLAVYKPLNNTRFEKFMNQTRSRFNAELIKNEHVLRRLIRHARQKSPAIIWLAGDQSPVAAPDYWFRFLNQDAMFYPGPAILSKRFNLPVFFQKMEKTGRGSYETTFELLIENPAEKSEKEILEIYIDKMEGIIREKPEYYLWTHKRWKRKRPKGIALQYQ